MMEVRTERENGTLIAEVEGRLDGVTAREFEDTMKAAIDEDAAAVVVDLEGVSYVSSAGLRAILLIAKDLRKRDAKFALCALAESVREVFEIAGFDKIIDIHGARAEAVAAAGG